MCNSVIIARLKEVINKYDVYSDEHEGFYIDVDIIKEIIDEFEEKP